MRFAERFVMNIALLAVLACLLQEACSIPRRARRNSKTVMVSGRVIRDCVETRGPIRVYLKEADPDYNEIVA